MSPLPYYAADVSRQYYCPRYAADAIDFHAAADAAEGRASIAVAAMRCRQRFADAADTLRLPDVFFAISPFTLLLPLFLPPLAMPSIILFLIIARHAAIVALLLDVATFSLAMPDAA